MSMPPAPPRTASPSPESVPHPTVLHPIVPPPSAPELERLHHKYLRLAELRAGVGVHSADHVREPLRELAREFPGSLRQIDVLSSERIQERAAALDAPSDPLPDWVLVTHAYHRLMQLSLWLKGKLAHSERDADGLARAAEERWGLPCSAGWVALVDKPPRGRLNALVFEALSAQFGRPQPELRALVFPRENSGRSVRDGGGD